MREHSDRMGKEPIPKLMISLAVPATFGMLVIALYNVVDAIFVARAVGMVGVAAVSIAFPVQIIVMALAGCIGIGGASMVSRMLGANKLDDANKVFGNIISLVLAVSVVGVFLGLNLLTPILKLFGSSATILPYAQDYLGVILYGTIFFAFGFCMNIIVRSEGNARTAMYAMVISAVLNVILTPLFLFGLGMGIAGSALATVLSQGVTAVYLLVYFARGQSSLSYKLAYLLPKVAVVRQILAIGSSAFMQQASGSIMFIFANHMLMFHGGDLAIAVFGIVHRVMMFAFMPVIGIMQGLMPLVGYNYGANLHNRVSESITLAIKASTAIVALGFIVVMVFPQQLMWIFINDPAAIEMGQTALRIIFALALTVGIQMVSGGVFQALGYAKTALILSMSRQVLFLIPLILTLPFIFGLSGVWLAFPVADLLSFILALWFINNYRSIFFSPDKVVIANSNVVG